MIDYYEGIKLGLSDGKVIGKILVNVDGITHGLDVGTDLGSLDGSFNGSKEENIEVLLLGDSLGSTDDRVFGYCWR